MRVSVSASDGYVTVTYLRHFWSDLSPVRLAMCAAINGFRAPARETFAYCEVGCGFGDTTLALAAAFPKATFVGIDLNPEHIESATRAAREGEVQNVRFIAGDFESVTDLETLDYVVAHGVISWISPEKRKALVRFASSKLAPGGLAHVGYNALPGWAAVEPLRQLIVARGGIDLAKALRDAGADYFERNPTAKQMLGEIEKAGPSYLAHEYLNASWVPMYFAQVAAEMAASDLYFVGQLPAHLNFRDLAIPESMRSIFASVGDRLGYEGLKDYALNTFFRSDVFIKGKPSPDEGAWLGATPFGLAGMEPPWTGEAKLPNHTLQYQGPVFDALVPALREGARAIAELLKRPELASMGEARVREALLHLLLGGAISPFAAPTRARTVGTEGLRFTSTYNRYVAERAASEGVPAVLASSALGNGIRLAKPAAVALVAQLGALPIPRSAEMTASLAKLVELGVLE